MSTHIGSEPVSSRPQRSNTNRMVAGVAGGLAEYARVDPLLIRVVFAVLTVFGGLGVIVYGICWLLLPREDEPFSIGESALRKGRSGGSVFSAIALVVAVAVMASFVWAGRFSDLGLLLLVLAAAVYFHRRREVTPAAESRPATAVTPAQTALFPPEGDVRTAPVTTVDLEADRIAAAGDAPAPPAPVKRSYSLITPIVLSILAVFLAVVIGLGDWVSVREYLAVSLGIVGAGVLVSTFYGKAIGLIILGIPLTFALLITSLMPLTAGGGYGSQTWRSTQARTIEKTYHLNAGSLLVDLSDVDFRNENVHTGLELGVGRAEFTVPRDVDVRVHGKVNGGEFRIMGHENNGPDVSVDRTDLGPDGRGGGTLDIRADIGFGQLVVHRAAS